VSRRLFNLILLWLIVFGLTVWARWMFLGPAGDIIDHLTR